MVWSPPIATSRVSSPMSSVAWASMEAIASGMSKGLATMSPASATCAPANGETFCAGL
jgi:hypothetical protein